jgi:hypothetical protein
MSDFMANSCGGVRWRTLPDGTTEVEGQGVTTHAPGSAEAGWVANNWKNWGPYFSEAAETYGVPVHYLVGIATNETGPWSNNPTLQAKIESGDGYSSIGIMQPLPSTAALLGFSAADRYDPRLNILMGAKLLGKLLEKYGDNLPLLAAGYNAGSVQCRPGANEWGFRMTGNYSGSAVRSANTALRDLDLGTSLSIPVLPVGIGAVAGAALGWSLWQLL